MTRVEIVIDELILRGVPPERAHEVAASVEARLGSLAAGEQGAVPERAEASRRLPEIDATPDTLGDSVGDAVWGSITGVTG